MSQMNEFEHKRNIAKWLKVHTAASFSQELNSVIFEIKHLQLAHYNNYKTLTKCFFN
jgi:hypothetical protein